MKRGKVVIVTKQRLEYGIYFNMDPKDSLPARASEQGKCNRVCPYIYIYVCVCTKKIVIERTRDLIYLKFVATDFFLKIIASVLAKTPVIQCSHCYSKVSALFTNPLPDHSNYLPL